MAKKYLSIQEAADQLGISTDELTRMREKGDVRGFADRGTWKFKLEDIEKLGRIRQPDSDPDVQLVDDDIHLSDEIGLHSVLEDEDDASENAGNVSTTIRKDDEDAGSEFELPDLGPSSDSDVRLILDDRLTGDSTDSTPEVNLVSDAQSDSDVRLVEEPDPVVDDGSDSDVKLVSNDSDSDVRLVSQTDDALTDSDSDVALVTSDSDMDSDDSILLSEGSDIALEEEEDSITGGSSIKLAGESGISLSSPADSGISLEKDSGLTLKQDSGITLEEDSGITLEEDSGITLEPEGDDLNQTIPMLKTMDDDDDVDDTQFEVPSLDSESGDESEFELQSLDDETENEANVLLFDDEDEADDQAETVVKKSASDEDDSLEIETLETGEVEFEDDELVADDVLDDEELDVFDTDDDDFDESFETGESHAEFASPVGGTRRLAAPMETEWGTGVFVGLSLSATAMCLCGMVVFDLVRTMWTGGDGSPVIGPITDMIAGLF